jgi:hypothetical protein
MKLSNLNIICGMQKSILVFGFVLAAVFTSAQEDLPFLPANEFEAKVALSFRVRKGEEANTFRFNEEVGRRKTYDKPIAFLAINFKLVKANEIVRMRSVHGSGGKTQKIKENQVLHFEMGFVEDIKSSHVPNELILYFLSDQKKELSKVIFLITADGDFLVNGEKRGKF